MDRTLPTLSDFHEARQLIAKEFRDSPVHLKYSLEGGKATMYAAVYGASRKEWLVELYVGDTRDAVLARFKALSVRAYEYASRKLQYGAVKVANKAFIEVDMGGVPPDGEHRYTTRVVNPRGLADWGKFVRVFDIPHFHGGDVTGITASSRELYHDVRDVLTENGVEHGGICSNSSDMELNIIAIKHDRSDPHDHQSVARAIIKILKENEV